VNEEQSLTLIVAYDRTKNEYAVVMHNQTPEETERYLGQWSRHLRPDCSFIVLDQAKRHTTEDATRCRACRDTALRLDKFESRPALKRRIE